MMPKLRWPSSTISSLPVFFTDLMIVSVSRGTMVRRSISSALMPSFCSCRTAFSALMVIMELVTTVISAPSATMRALPKGMHTSSSTSGTSLNLVV